MAGYSGYSGTPLSKKLGIKEGFRVFHSGAPESYRASLEPLPEPVEFVSAPDARTDLAHVFCDRGSDLAKELARLRGILHPDAIVWASWPKKSSGIESDITDNVVREVALPLGFVDIKVCAVDETWSGLKLMVRKELRG